MPSHRRRPTGSQGRIENGRRAGRPAGISNPGSAIPRRGTSPHPRLRSCPSEREPAGPLAGGIAADAAGLTATLLTAAVIVFAAALLAPRQTMIEHQTE